MKNRTLTTLIISLSMFNLFGQKKPDSKAVEFKFEDEETKPTFVCSHVLNKEKPILYASHDSDGDWQFLCGGENHTEADANVISLKQAVGLDPTVNDLYEMPKNVGAERKSIKDKWKPFRLED